MKTGVWILAGSLFFVWIVLAGSAMHFVYEWSGNSDGTAWMAAVNESVWEHMKLYVWPWVVGTAALGVWLAVRQETRPLLAPLALGSAVGLLLAIVTVPTVFYAYTSVLHSHNLFADIAVFVLGAALGAAVLIFLTAYALASVPVDAHVPMAVLGVGVLAGIATVFAVFTYRPPPTGLFADPQEERE